MTNQPSAAPDCAPIATAYCPICTRRQEVLAVGSRIAVGQRCRNCNARLDAAALRFEFNPAKQEKRMKGPNWRDEETCECGMVSGHRGPCKDKRTKPKAVGVEKSAAPESADRRLIAKLGEPISGLDESVLLARLIDVTLASTDWTQVPAATKRRIVEMCLEVK